MFTLKYIQDYLDLTHLKKAGSHKVLNVVIITTEMKSVELTECN